MNAIINKRTTIEQQVEYTLITLNCDTATMLLEDGTRIMTHGNRVDMKVEITKEGVKFISPVEWFVMNKVEPQPVSIRNALAETEADNLKTSK